jgi:hypothetical protein
MPWYISFGRIAYFAGYMSFGLLQAKWIIEAEDRYKRSLSWKPAVGTITEHKIVFNKFGASHVWYKFKPDILEGDAAEARAKAKAGEGNSSSGSSSSDQEIEYSGDQFRSGGMFKEEHLRHANLLGVGTELVVYYNPGDPSESALKIACDRGLEAYFLVNTLLCLYISYRCLRCETILPHMFYRFLNVNRRFSENTGMRLQRTTQKRPGTSYPKGWVSPHAVTTKPSSSGSAPSART